MDRKIISDIVKRILDNSYKHDEFIDLINGRKKKYWYKTSFEYDYMVLEYSLYFFNKITTINDVKNIKTIEEFVKSYEDKYQEIDYIYRKFSTAAMNVENSDIYKDLIELINNKYDMDFIQEIQEKWYKLISEKNDYNINTIEKQQDFYKNNIETFENKKERVFVIISDALRYECGKELYKGGEPDYADGDLEDKLGDSGYYYDLFPEERDGEPDDYEKGIIGWTYDGDPIYKNNNSNSKNGTNYNSKDLITDYINNYKGNATSNETRVISAGLAGDIIQTGDKIYFRHKSGTFHK